MFLFKFKMPIIFTQKSKQKTIKPIHIQKTHKHHEHKHHEHKHRDHKTHKHYKHHKHHREIEHTRRRRRSHPKNMAVYLKDKMDKYRTKLDNIKNDHTTDSIYKTKKLNKLQDKTNQLKNKISQTISMTTNISDKMALQSLEFDIKFLLSDIDFAKKFV